MSVTLVTLRVVLVARARECGLLETHGDTPKPFDALNEVQGEPVAEREAIAKRCLLRSATAQGIQHRRNQPEERFEGAPEWPALDRFGRTWPSHLLFIAGYTAFYVAFAPSWQWYLLLPVHYLMGPVHGAIVNWCGHKYGYRNFDTTRDDRSRNSLAFDFITLGELFQNNHHKFGMSPNFAARWFEIDPTYVAIRLFAAAGIIDLGPAPQLARFPMPRNSEASEA